jgi:hypothetical protein
MEIFGLSSIMSYNREVIFSFKQQSNEWLVLLGKDLDGSLLNENMVLEIG